MARLLPLLLLAALARADVEEITQGVKTIGKPGAPGPVALLDDSAFAIAGTRMGDGTVHPLVAAAKPGRGRVVALGHGGYFGKKTLATGSSPGCPRW